MAEVLRRAQETERTDTQSGDYASLISEPAGKLIQIWHREFGKSAPVKLSKSLLARLLAYRLQAERYGDLPRDTLRTLGRIANELEVGRKAVIAPAQDNCLKPGSILVREHAGVMHRVMVLADGFAWNGETCQSLSAVAKAITGTNWNGHAFFGLKEIKDARRKRSAERPS